jgi:hypothetical protein
MWVRTVHLTRGGPVVPAWSRTVPDMNRRSFLAALTAAWPAAVAAAATAVPAHLRWARSLVTELLPEFNAYGSRPTFVEWADRPHGKPARNRSVCSSFVSRLLERAYGVGTSDLLSWTGLAEPQAKDYFAAISAGRGFTRVSRVGDIVAGDFVSLDYPPHNRPTGHIMLADSAPLYREAVAPLRAGTRQYSLHVIDCATTGHGKQDTRIAPGGWARGVGRGTIRLYTDDDGTIVGHTWSRKPRSRFYATSERAMVVGRLRAAPPRGGHPLAERDRFVDDAPQTET